MNTVTGWIEQNPTMTAVGFQKRNGLKKRYKDMYMLIILNIYIEVQCECSSLPCNINIVTLHMRVVIPHCRSGWRFSRGELGPTKVGETPGEERTMGPKEEEKEKDQGDRKEVGQSAGSWFTVWRQGKKEKKLRPTEKSIQIWMCF